MTRDDIARLYSGQILDSLKRSQLLPESARFQEGLLRKIIETEILAALERKDTYDIAGEALPGGTE